MLAVMLGMVSSASAATISCSLYASPSGSDSNPGTLASPMATLEGLDGKLAAGQTGCLEAGSYGDIHTYSYLTNNGTATGQITLTSAPGQTAHLNGLIAVEGAYTTLSGLDIDGSNDLYASQRAGTSCPYPVSNGLEIDGRGDIFENNNYYQSIASLRGNGIGIGWNTPADGAIIRNNRIHDLGQCQAYDQMIYLAHGDNVQIYDNWMWNDPHGWGVQIYPGAANAHVYSNVIDGAGSGIVIGGSNTVANNTVNNNVIVNSTGLTNAGLTQGVGVSTVTPIGTGNTFSNNDVYNNPGGIANASGITIAANITTNPQFANAASHDYRTTNLTSDNLWNGNLGTLTSTTTTTDTTAAVGSAATVASAPAPSAAPTSTSTPRSNVVPTSTSTPRPTAVSATAPRSGQPTRSTPPVSARPVSPSPSRTDTRAGHRRVLAQIARVRRPSAGHHAHRRPRRRS